MLLGVVAGVVAVAATRWALVQSSAQERHALRWLLTGSALALLPMPASFPSTRLTLATAVGVAVLFAIVLRRAFTVLATGPLARPNWFAALALGYGVLLFQIWEPLHKDFLGMSIHFRSVTQWVLQAEVEDSVGRSSGYRLARLALLVMTLEGLGQLEEAARYEELFPNHQPDGRSTLPRWPAAVYANRGRSTRPWTYFGEPSMLGCVTTT